MSRRPLRSPEERVGTIGNAALPPPLRTKSEPTERLLHRAFVDRDDRALAAAFEDLRPRMLRLAANHVRSMDDAEDVVQDTWIAALAGIDRFEGRASLETWLLRILSYRARSAGRRNGRLVPFSQLGGSSGDGAPASLQLVDPAPDPEAAAVGSDLRSRVEAALDDLPRRQGEVVRLRDLEGWSPGEVSERLRVSSGNQRVLLHRGRTMIRELVPN